MGIAAGSLAAAAGAEAPAASAPLTGFSGEGISFRYPSGWFVTTAPLSNGIPFNASSAINVVLRTYKLIWLKCSILTNGKLNRNNPLTTSLFFRSENPRRAAKRLES